MKIMMTRENLGRMLKGVSYAVAKRATMPAMENVEIGPTRGRRLYSRLLRDDWMRD